MTVFLAFSSDNQADDEMELSPSRILVFVPNWLGDSLMALPALRAIRRWQPTAQFVLVVRRRLATLFNSCEWVDGVITYRRGRTAPLLAEVPGLVAALREGSFDLAVLFPNSFESALWVRLAKIPERVGFSADARSWLLTRSCPRPRGRNRHQAEIYLELVRRLLCAPGSRHDIDLEVGQCERDRARCWLLANRRQFSQPLIAISPGAAYGPSKRWPATSFAHLTDLVHDAGGEVMLVGAPQDQARCAEVGELCAVSPLRGYWTTDVAAAAGLLSECDAFIGNDSGGMHLASAVGLPVVAIFGSTDPCHSAPSGLQTRVVRERLDCSPCFRRRCRYRHTNCLLSISPERVFAALGELGFDFDRAPGS